MNIDKGFIVGVINAVAWGLGHLMTGKYFYGGLWLAAYMLIGVSPFFTGYYFYIDTPAGNLLIVAFSAISAAFLYEGIQKDVKINDSWSKFKGNLIIFVPAALAAGFIVETANEVYLGRWWIYLSPWSSYGPLGTSIGPLLLIGWLIMIGITISLSYLLVKYLKLGVFGAWLVSWLALGFAIETFNTLVWRTWYYHDGTIWETLVIPGLDYGILVPLLGYVGTGIFTYFTYIIALKLIEPKNEMTGIINAAGMVM
jgi:hypothetical protein